MPGQDESPAAPAVLVQARGVGHTFRSDGRERLVLSQVDFDVAAGEFIALTGPSGAGKTTLLTLIGALRHLQLGRIELDGVDLGALDGPGRTRLRRRIGFIFQDHHLFDSLTAEQTLAVTMRLHAERYTAADFRERPRAWLERLGLAGHVDHRPGQLSTGQKQRVAIARALINEPRLVIADEPTAALDRATGEQVIALLRETARGSGSGVLMVSHDPRHFPAVDRVVEMVDGRIDRVTAGSDWAGGSPH